jgi:hypothetical protein
MKHFELGLTYADCHVEEELQVEYEPRVTELREDKHCRLCFVSAVCALTEDVEHLYEMWLLPYP